MYTLCSVMNWTHLPREGGLEDQDPMFLDAVLMAESERAAHEKREAEKQKREAKRKR